MSLGKCKLKQDTTFYSLDWPKSRTLITANARRMGSNRNSHASLWECKVAQLPEKTVGWFLTKLNRLFPYDLETVLLDMYPKELQTYFYVETRRDVNSSFIHNCPNLETTKMSFIRWINIWTAEYYLVLK